ncbi:MAG: hypothetical protein QG634_585, partial [Patescibacteria group bacterium]|nr:hypothetical protein [Patescibacteria group bacterium]
TIPILNKKEIIEYIEIEKLIWTNGKELGLVGLEQYYGDDLKLFFIKQVGVVEKPTIQQYIEHLKSKPKNHQKVFYEFIIFLSKILKTDESIDLNEEIILINDTLFSFQQIIFNDEFVENAENINNLFSVEKRYFQIFNEIITYFELSKISDCTREIVLTDLKEDEKIYDIYFKLLNYSWDYIYSNDNKKFEKLKTDDDFILKTKNIEKGSYANIILKIDVDGNYIDVVKNFIIKNETVYIHSNIDERELVKEIAKCVQEQIPDINFDTLERFYDKVYKYKEYSKNEYYKSEKIEEAKGDNTFDNIFEKISQKIEEQEDGSDILEDDEQENKKDIGNHHEKADDASTKSYQGSNGNSEVSKKPSENIQTTEVKKDSVENEKTICPECNVELNKQNLEKHLCKVHHKNCKGNDENAKNNQNNYDTPNLNEAIKSHDKNIARTEDNLNPSIVKDEEKDTQKTLTTKQNIEKHKSETYQWQEDIDPDIIIDEKKYIENFIKKVKEDIQKYKDDSEQQKIIKQIEIIKKSNISENQQKDKIKLFLANTYKGYCQICGFTFRKVASSENSFELYSWNDKRVVKNKKSFISTADSLCLCRNCSANIKWGAFEPTFLEHIKNIQNFETATIDDIKKEIHKAVDKNLPDIFEQHLDFNDMYALEIKLNDEPRNIYFTDIHLIQFIVYLQLESDFSESQ